MPTLIKRVSRRGNRLIRVNTPTPTQVIFALGAAIGGAAGRADFSHARRFGSRQTGRASACRRKRSLRAAGSTLGTGARVVAGPFDHHLWPRNRGQAHCHVGNLPLAIATTSDWARKISG